MAQFTISGEFNASNALLDFEKVVASEILSITDEAFEVIYNDVTQIFEDIITLNFESLPAFPTLPYDFNVDNITDIPECQLRFQFDGLELFLETEIKLSAGATYTVNLYSSNSPLGFSVGSDLRVGVVFAIDLILAAETEIDVTSGFHIKLDDGLAIDITLFGTDVSDITL